MNKSSESRQHKNAGYKWFVLGCLALGLVGWLLKFQQSVRTGVGAAHRAENPGRGGSPSRTGQDPYRDQRWRQRLGVATNISAEEVVQGKLADFGRKRLEWVRATSLRVGKEVPPEVEAFFKAVQRGNWDEIDAIWSEMAKRSGQYEGGTHSPELDPFWPAILEAYGAAEQSHLWPADKLLEYGEAILGSLRPGMVYVGGTDQGRFVPTFLNETGEGEPHIILTQNALADSRYLGYIRDQYGDRMTLPGDEESKQIFDDYVQDARRRLEHDQQFPNEPKQVKPGEQVEVKDGKVSVGGQIAVMSINEKLLQWAVDRNPEMSFAVEESFPFKSTYPQAVPLGPIMEIRAETPFEDGHASETLAYWREKAQELLQGPPSETASDLKTYSHMAVSQANLLASHQYLGEAEATYKLATEIFPGNTDAALSYAQFLADHGRSDESQRVLSQFSESNPDLKQQLAKMSVTIQADKLQ